MTIEQLIARSADRYFAQAFRNLGKLRDSLAEQGYDDDEIGDALAISIDMAVADWREQLPGFERWLRECRALPAGTAPSRAEAGHGLAGAPAGERVH